MKIVLLVLFTLFFCNAWSQVKDTTAYLVKTEKHKTPKSHPVVITGSAGFIDYYKNNYSLPAGYEKNNTSGYSLFYGKLEYFLGRQVSIAGTFSYDAFTYNYLQDFSGNSGDFTRSKTDNFRLAGGGLTAFYHFGPVMHTTRFDPFIGVGVSLNNVRYSAYPQGDTTAVKTLHTTTPYLKAGTRFYLSRSFSLFGDVGYDKLSVFSLGVSYRFSKKQAPAPPPVDDGYVIAVKVDTIKPKPPLDSDGDGIPDTADKCPFVAGPVSNHGCPVLDTPKPVKLYELGSNTIQFQFDRTAIYGSSYPMLDTAARVLNDNPDFDLMIDGYADITGTIFVNKRISRQRAEVVKRYLVNKGIDENRLFTKGHGSRNPIASNFTRAGRAKNRRVVITLKLVDQIVK